MSRKHENFNWSGYRHAPETIRFSLNGKPFVLPEDVRSYLGYLAACGRKDDVIRGLKQYLRKTEKTSNIIGKCICFFKKNSNEFYYTKQLMYNPNDISQALYAYKEWKRYIKDKNCILESGFNVESGSFVPYVNSSNVETREVFNIVDLNRCRTINIVRA